MVNCCYSLRVSYDIKKTDSMLRSATQKKGPLSTSEVFFGLENAGGVFRLPVVWYVLKIRLLPPKTSPKWFLLKHGESIPHDQLSMTRHCRMW